MKGEKDGSTLEKMEEGAYWKDMSGTTIYFLL